MCNLFVFIVVLVFVQFEENIGKIFFISLVLLPCKIIQSSYLKKRKDNTDNLATEINPPYR
jgi:hypothetical protein